MGAAAAGRDDIVQLLLDHGADPSLMSEDGKTAADVAREHRHSALAERLRSP
jgi:ankyrin repeat protein